MVSRLRGLLPIGLVFAFAVLVGVGGFTFIYARGYSYLLDDPAICTNCHIMRDQYAGWSVSSHRSVTCNGCHTPHQIVPKYLVKAENGFAHSWAFTFEDPQVIQIKRGSRAVVEANCKECHNALVEATFLVEEGAGVDGKDCTRCHARVGHAF
jgi:cytochrome c nitrite reductase small subunit